MRLALLLALGLFVPATVAAQTLASGRWEARSTVTEVTIKGASPMIASAVAKALKGKTQTRSACLVAGAPPISLFVAPGAKCSWTRAQVAAGRIDAAGSCLMKGRSVALVLSGSYTESTYTVRNRVETTTPVGPMTLIADATATRSGACG